MNKKYQESDWKLFKQKIHGWQEDYMSRLIVEYSNLLNKDELPFYKISELRDKINDDFQKTSLIVNMRRSKLFENIIDLLDEKCITMSDLKDFSDELQENVKKYYEIINGVKMKYRKIKVSFKYFPERFNRELYVREDISLENLGCVLVTALGGAFEHYFLFRDKKVSYNPSIFLEDYRLDDELDMKDYKMLDLSDTFTFLYDTGDGWEFNVKVYKKVYEIEDDEYEDSLGIIISAVGQGIWEDNIYSLEQYLSGAIKNLTKQNMDEGLCFPWNHEIKSFADFDKEVDLENLQMLIDSCRDFDDYY